MAPLLAVADPLRVDAGLVVPEAGHFPLRALQLPPGAGSEAVVLVAAVHAVPFPVASPFTEEGRSSMNVRGHYSPNYTLSKHHLTPGRVELKIR